MRRSIFFLILLCVAFNLSAQMTKEELLYAKPVSVRRAAVLSALLPGAGEYYAGKKEKAAFFMAAELGFWAGYFLINQEKDQKIDSYKKLASVYGGIEGGIDATKYSRMQEFISSDEYNRQMEQYYRNAYLVYLNDYESYIAAVEANKIQDGEGWQWDSTKHFYKYNDQRKDKQDLEMYVQLVSGILIANRVVSIVDAVVSARNRNRNTSLSLQPDWDNKGVRLSYEYRF